MSPQRHLGNFIDALLLAYVLSENTNMQEVKRTIIDDYRKLNEKCDVVISKMRERKEKSLPPPAK
jgi:hypothetical protein